MRKVILAIAAVMLVVMGSQAQSKLSNFGRLLVQEQKEAKKQSNPNGAMAHLLGVKEHSMVDCFVHFEKEIDQDLLERYGAELHTRYDKLGIATAAVPEESLEALSEDPAIKLVEVGMPVKQNLYWARQFSEVDKVHQGAGNLGKGYTGKGVIVGVVDQEFQLSHPNFWNTAHNKYRVKRFWNQGKRVGTKPAGFDYGAEYTDSAAILQQEYDMKNHESAHATHVMGIAAGACKLTEHYGIAYDADLVAVAVSGTMYGYSSTALPDGIKYIFDYADLVNKPAVVNVSMGSTIGPHDGTSTESRLIDAMVGPGRLVCGSAGNSGVSKIHAAFNLNATDTLGKTCLAFVYTGMQDYGYVDIWGEVGQDFDVKVVVYNRDTKENLWESKVCSTTKATGAPNYIQNDSLDFAVSLVSEVNSANNRGHVTLTATSTKMPKRHVVGIIVTSHETGTVNLWTLETTCTLTNNGMKKDGWTDGDSNITIDEPMGVTDGVISVGSYTTFSRYPSQRVGEVSSFSSHGPRPDGAIKPDIVAPGEVLMSSISDDKNLTSERKVTVNVGGRDYYYGYMQGTSMSSPYCAGVVATWLEADPTLTPDRIRDVFRHTSILDANTGNTNPNATAGYGKLNAYQGILYILGKTTAVQNPESAKILTAYPNPTDGIFSMGFAVDDENVTVSVIDLSGRIVMSETRESVAAGEEFNIDLSGIANGAYVVRVCGNTVNETLKVIKD